MKRKEPRSESLSEINIEKDLETSLPLTKGDAAGLQNVFLNLLINEGYRCQWPHE